MVHSTNPRYFLGADVGATKTHVLITDETGRVAGFGEAGPGNHESVGYGGLARSLCAAAEQALAEAGISKEQIAGAGFGVAGFDWPSEKEPTLQAIGTIGLRSPMEAVNDSNLGLLAVTEEGWGIAVVSGTGCNCRGWNKDRRREGMVTGAGSFMGEAAGAGELVHTAIRAVSHAWSLRGPATQLTQALVNLVGARDAGDLLEGLINDRYHLRPSAAPLIFETAAAGDEVAINLLRWAGQELGEMVKAVARQLEFDGLAFDVVLVGSTFNGGPLLIEPMRETILANFPGARLARMTVPPVVGGVVLGMELAGVKTPGARQRLIAHFS